MNEKTFANQVGKENFGRVVRYLHSRYDPADAKKSRVRREEIIADLFGKFSSKEEFEEKRQLLETVARVSKTEWGQKLYEEFTGVRGFIQATAVNKKSYYEAVVGKKPEKYNPRSVDDVSLLVQRTIPHIVRNPDASAEEIASILSREFGYVIGSILPSIGIVRAIFNRRLQSLSDALAKIVEKEKASIFAGDGETFLKKVTETFGEHAVPPDAGEIAREVAAKLDGARKQ